MNSGSERLIDLMICPTNASRLSPDAWTEILSMARAANLVGSLCVRLEHAKATVPLAVKRHLDGVSQLSDRQCESVRWEAYQLASALGQLNIPVLLLKGSAYVLGELPTRLGRVFGDIDILVPRASLEDVELAMMTKGWTSAKQSAYDQRYYRQWMHELPPMINVRRGTVLDIHHTLLPLTSRHTPDPQKLIEASREVPGLAPLRIPSSQDLVIHSITHLFHEGELHNGLRDLFDIDGLIRHFADTVPDFWETLVARAIDLQLEQSLFLGLHFSSHILGTPVPSYALDKCGITGAPSPAVLWLLEALYNKGLQPMHPACDSALTGPARWLIYLRAHWLRMPPYLLAMHLSRKTWKSIFPEKKNTSIDQVDDLPP